MHYIYRKCHEFSIVHVLIFKPKITRLAGRKFAKPQAAEKFRFSRIKPYFSACLSGVVGSVAVRAVWLR